MLGMAVSAPVMVRVQCQCGCSYECAGEPFKPSGIGFQDLVVYYPKKNCPGCQGSLAAKHLGRTGFWIPPTKSKLEVLGGSSD